MPSFDESFPGSAVHRLIIGVGEGWIVRIFLIAQLVASPHKTLALGPLPLLPRVDERYE